MIQKEHYLTRKDGVNIVRTFSDAGVKIRKTGSDYVDNQAFDVEDAPYEYEETDIPVGAEHPVQTSEEVTT